MWPKTSCYSYWYPLLFKNSSMLIYCYRTNHHLINHPKAMPHPNKAMHRPHKDMHLPRKVTWHLPRGTVRHHRDTFHILKVTLRLRMYITHINQDMPRLPNKCTPLACIPRTPAPQWLSGEERVQYRLWYHRFAKGIFLIIEIHALLHKYACKNKKNRTFGKVRQVGKMITVFNMR